MARLSDRVLARLKAVHDLIYVPMCLVTFAVLLLFAAIGLWQMIYGAMSYWLHPDSSSAADAIAMALKGLEFLFLAPLGFMVVVSVGQYLRAMVENNGTDATARDGPRANAKAQLLTVKSFVVSLMIAVVATELVSRVLEPGELHTESAFAGTIVIVAFSLYLFVLEKFAKADA